MKGKRNGAREGRKKRKVDNVGRREKTKKKTKDNTKNMKWRKK